MLAESTVQGNGSQRNETAGTCTTTKHKRITHSVLTTVTSDLARYTVNAKNANKNVKFCSETQTRVVNNVSNSRSDH
jgi:hypothetical protein